MNFNITQEECFKIRPNPHHGETITIFANHQSGEFLNYQSCELRYCSVEFRWIPIRWEERPRIANHPPLFRSAGVDRLQARGYLYRDSKPERRIDLSDAIIWAFFLVLVTMMITGIVVERVLR